MESLFGIFGSKLGAIAPFLIVLGVVVFVHEYGHYIVGRWCGIHAERFSLGFGGRVFGWTDRRGTEWRVSWIPLGGYVMFTGDATAASTEDEAAMAELSPAEARATMHGAPLWARSATVAAGPIANFILTTLLVAGIALTVGRATSEPIIGDIESGGQAAAAGFVAGDRVISVDGEAVQTMTEFLDAMFPSPKEPPDRDRIVELTRGGETTSLKARFERPAVVGQVVPNGAAAAACMEPGDQIKTVNGAPIGSFMDLRRMVEASDGAALTLQLRRDGELKTVQLEPRRTERRDPRTGEFETVMMIGVAADFDLGLAPARESVGPVAAIGEGVSGVWRVISGTFAYYGALISADADGSSISGPLGIAQFSNDAANGGVIAFVGFIATVSAAIGLLNLFPIPLLDGGHLLFYGVEMVSGRPVSDRVQKIAARVGGAAIIFLILFATRNDLVRLFAGVGVSC